jgi:UMF1 family MFS transporter
VVTYAYAFLHRVSEAWVLACSLRWCSGDLSLVAFAVFAEWSRMGARRHFLDCMKFLNVGTSWLGPIVFAEVVAYTGSYRQAILSLIVFFVIGTIILLVTDTTARFTIRESLCLKKLRQRLRN